MSLLSYAGIGIVVILILMMILIVKSNKRTKGNKAYVLSLISISLIILNLILYLGSFYVIGPEIMGNLIFSSVWILVSILGFIAAYKEYNNNRSLAVLNGGLAIINSIIGMLAWGIGNM